MTRSILLACLLFTACGSDTPPDAPLAPGVVGRAADRVRVRVVNARDGAPLEGAQVASDDASGVTDALGEVLLPAGDSVRAEAAGFRGETFVGAEAAAMTFALEPLAAPATRTVTITLAGWSEQVAREGEGLVARISVGRDSRIDHAAVPNAECLGTSTTCEVALTVPEGTSSAFAELAVVDDGGTPEDSSDDVEAPLGFAFGALTETATLEAVDAVVEVELDLALPPGIDRVVGVPGIRVDGEVLVFATPSHGRTRFAVPTLTGRFEGATLWAIASHESGETVARTVVRADPGELRGTFELPAPLTVVASRVGDVIEVETSAPLLSLASASHVVRVFDGRTSVASPNLSGALIIAATEAPRFEDGWNLDLVERQWTRRTSQPLP